MTAQTQAVLAALLQGGERYGLEISKEAGLLSGTIYPILARLERAGLVASRWEEIEPAIEGRRRRRYYRLTGEGETVARAELTRTVASLQAVLQPRPLPTT